MIRHTPSRYTQAAPAQKERAGLLWLLPAPASTAEQLLEDAGSYGSCCMHMHH